MINSKIYVITRIYHKVIYIVGLNEFDWKLSYFKLTDGGLETKSSSVLL